MRTPYSVLLAIAALLSSGIAGPALAQSSTSGCDYLHGEFLNKINIGAIGNLQHGNDNGNAVFVETVNGQWVGLDNAHNLDEPEGRAFAKMMLLAHVNYLRRCH